MCTLGPGALQQRCLAGCSIGSPAAVEFYVSNRHLHTQRCCHYPQCYAHRRVWTCCELPLVITDPDTRCSGEAGETSSTHTLCPHPVPPNLRQDPASPPLPSAPTLPGPESQPRVRMPGPAPTPLTLPATPSHRHSKTRERGCGEASDLT